MRFGPQATLLAGLVCIGAGLLLFARTPVDGDYLTDVMPPMVLIGLGAGLGFPALMTLAMSGATPSDAGLASGLVNTTRAGRRRDRPGRAGDARDRAHRRPARRRRVDGRGAQLRLPPRLPDRRGAGRASRSCSPSSSLRPVGDGAAAEHAPERSTAKPAYA